MTKREVPPTWSPKRYPFRTEPPCIGYYFIFIDFFFISLAKKKQTDRQTERTLAGTPQQLWPITAGPDTNKKNKNKKY